MIIFAPTTDKLQLVTDIAASSIEVHASYIDYATGSVTPGRTNTVITTATATDIVAAPAASTQRQLKALYIRNSSTSTVMVTINYINSSLVCELYSVLLGPQGLIEYNPDHGFSTSSQSYSQGDLWGGNIISCVRDGNPNYALNMMQLGGNTAPTPTNIGATVVRCEAFRPAYSITVNRIRWYGIGAVAAIYTMAIYNFHTMTRVSEQFTITTTAANAFESVAVTTQFTLNRGTLYFIGVSANTTGTVAGIGAMGTTTAAATGVITAAPMLLPGNLRLNDDYISSFRFQFATAAGAMPTSAPAYVAPAAWTGGMPLFFLDNNTGA